MNFDGMTASHIWMFAWATPRPGMTLDELIWHLENETSNTVLEIDREGNRVKLADVKEEL